MSDGSGEKKSGRYKLYRKLRFLQFRGTLFNKTPRKIRLRIRQKKRRKALRFFRCLNLRARNRLDRLYSHRSQITRLNPPGYLMISGQPSPAPPEIVIPLKTMTISERLARLRRFVGFLTRRRKQLRQRKRAARAARIKPSYIRYRKLRYLFVTGKLFKINTKKLKDYYYRNFGFIYRKKYLIIFVNSLSLFLIAAISMYVIRQFATALVSSTFDIQTIVYYFNIDFLIRGRDWGPESVKIIFSTGPFVALLLALIALVVFFKYHQQRGIFRLFIFWVFCFGWTGFFGEALMGSLLGDGFGYVIMYLFFMDTAKMIITFLSITALVAVGLFITNSMLLTANTYCNYLVKRNRGRFVFSQIILPYLVGTLILYFLKQPEATTLEVAVNLSMIFLLAPALIRSIFNNELFFDEEPRKFRVYIWLIFAAIIILSVFRIIFERGIRI